jgi:hypothetical protein
VYTALRATSVTLASLLRATFVADPLLGPFFSSGMDVQLLTPHDLSQPSATGGLSVWLYRVVRDEQQLNALPRRVAPAIERHAPLPLRLHYLMTPIVATQSGAPELEQAILGKVLQTFHDRPIIEGSDLQDDLAGTSAELRVRLETQRLDELAEVWEALDRAYQLSVSYEVGIVPIDSARPVGHVTPIHEAVTEHGVGSILT